MVSQQRILNDCYSQFPALSIIITTNLSDQRLFCHCSGNLLFRNGEQDAQKGFCCSGASFPFGAAGGTGLGWGLHALNRQRELQQGETLVRQPERKLA